MLPSRLRVLGRLRIMKISGRVVLRSTVERVGERGSLGHTGDRAPTRNRAINEPGFGLFLEAALTQRILSLEPPKSERPFFFRPAVPPGTSPTTAPVPDSPRCSHPGKHWRETVSLILYDTAKVDVTCCMPCAALHMLHAALHAACHIVCRMQHRMWHAAVMLYMASGSAR